MATTTTIEVALSFTMQTHPEHIGTVIDFAKADRTNTELRRQRAFVAHTVARGMFANEAQATAAYVAAQSGSLKRWQAAQS